VARRVLGKLSILLATAGINNNKMLRRPGLTADLSVIVEGFSLMRSSIRTVIVVAVAAALVVVFLRNVDLRLVVAAIVRARMRWLVISLLASVLSIVIRSLRWQYLLEPLGHASFANAFRATAVGFAASSVLPAARERSFAHIFSRVMRT